MTALLDIPGFVDGASLRCLKSGAFTTLAGRGGAVLGTLISGARGTRIGTGAGTVILTGLPDCRPFTIIADMQGVATGQQAWGWLLGMTNASGIDGLGGQALVLNSLGAGTVFSKDPTNGAQTAGTLSNYGSALGVSTYDPSEKIIALSYDDNTWPGHSLFVDGKFVATTTSPSVRTLAPLTQLTIGGKHATTTTYSTPYNGTVASFAVFDRALSPAEHAAVYRALRADDPRTENIVVLGDSLSTVLSDADGKGVENWPWQWSRSAGFDARLINHGVNGSPATPGAKHFSIRASGYGAQPTTLIILHGTAGILLGLTAAQEWDSIQTMCRAGRAEGYRVVVCTVPRGQAGGFTTAQETQRVGLNISIRAGGAEYDALADIEAVIEPLTDASYWTDAVHPSAKGKGVVAKYIAGGGL